MRKIAISILAAALFSACLPSPSGGDRRSKVITVYGFSIMKESLENDIYPAFAAQWKQQHGEDVNFNSSFAGSETITNQILQGAPADIAILSIERDVQRMIAAGHVDQEWWVNEHKGIINKTPFIILVRKGNPLGIRDFPDLAKPGVKVIHPDPISSGGAQWSILSIYGSELKKTESETGSADTERAVNTLAAVWKNVISTPGSAREARTQFETGYGDALITYEIEGLLMKHAGAPFEMVIPQSTILSEHPAVVVNRNIMADEQEVVYAFRNFLWSDIAQRAFVKNHFRAVTNEAYNDANPDFARIEMPFGIDLFGGWHRAYPDIIEGIFRDRVKDK